MAVSNYGTEMVEHDESKQYDTAPQDHQETSCQFDLPWLSCAKESCLSTKNGYHKDGQSYCFWGHP